MKYNISADREMAQKPAKASRSSSRSRLTAPAPALTALHDQMGNRAVGQLVQMKSATPLLQRADEPPKLSVYNKPPNLSTIASLQAGLVLEGFALDHWQLTSVHAVALAEYKARMAQFLVQYPNSFITIVGHTDASGSEAHNETLGQQRAEAVLAALANEEPAIPGDKMRAYNMGERMLRVKVLGREPRNRRVEIQVQARHGFQMPLPQPTRPWQPLSPIRDPLAGYDLRSLPYEGAGSFIPSSPISRFQPPQSEWLEHYLRSDPLLKKALDLVPESLREDARDLVIDALKDMDQMVAEKAIGGLPIGDQSKQMLTQTVIALLKQLKGQKFVKPISPTHTPHPKVERPFPVMPEEKIFNLPAIPF